MLVTESKYDKKRTHFKVPYLQEGETLLLENKKETPGTSY